MLQSAASSPSMDKLSKPGSQKVPPLTIKLSATSTSAASTAKEAGGAMPPASTSGEPYVMLPDKETERANSALAKGLNVTSILLCSASARLPFLLSDLPISVCCLLKFHIRTKKFEFFFNLIRKC